MKIKILIKEWGITVRQFLLILLIAFLIFAFLSWYNVISAINSVEMGTNAEYKNLLEKADSFLDNFVNNIRSVIVLLSSEWESFDNNNEEKALGLLKKYSNYSNCNIKTLYLIRSNGEVLCGKQLLYDIFGNSSLSKLYKQAISGVPGIKWSDPYYSSLSGTTIAFHTPIRKPSGEFLGVIVAECDINALERTLNKQLVGTQYSYILLSTLNAPIAYNVDNNFMLTKKRTYPPEIDNRFLQEISMIRRDISDTNSFGTPLILYKSQKNSLGWKCIIVVDQRYMNAIVSEIYRKYIFSLVIWFFVLSISSLLITIWLNAPIRNLVIKMRSISSIDSLSEIQTERTDEVGQLIKSYNFMINNIHNLVHGIRIYELKMLRSQIGPHFLYNTLSCINILAKQHKTSEVRQTINALIDLLSFSFDRESEFVKLEDELKSIDNYIYIQKIRFGEIFTYTLDADPKCNECLIPKLTLQPIVENSIFHGIMADKSEYKKIVVRTRLYGSMLSIFIFDNGAGIEDKKIRRLLELSDNDANNDRFSGIGLSNVNQRLGIYYGSKYKLTIRSSVGIGTAIKIKIPSQCNMKA